MAHYIVQREDTTPPKIPLVFYRSVAGNEPVRTWLKGLERSARLEIGADMQRVQYRWPVGMPLCRALGNGLWEVRTDLPDKTISRVFICFHGGLLYALHGFIKRTRKTPDGDLALARRRKKEIETGS
jgi:phage-related protein